MGDEEKRGVMGESLSDMGGDDVLADALNPHH